MFDKIKSYFKKKSIDAGAMVGYDTPSNYIDVYGKQRQPDKQGLLREYRGIGYACANKNAQGCIKPRLRLYRKGKVDEKKLYNSKTLHTGEIKLLQKRINLLVSDKEKVEEITSHRILDVLEHPNDRCDLIQLLEFTQLYQEILGCAYWYPIPDRLGVPQGIDLFLPQYMKAVINSDNGYIDHYDYGEGIAKTQYKPEEVIAFLVPNPSNPWLEGLSPIVSVYESLNILNKYASVEAALLDNDGRPAGILKAKDGIGEEEAKKWERRFNTKFRRAGNGGVLVLEEDAEFSPLSYNPRDLARLGIYDNARLAICLAYGVPPALLNEQGASQYNVNVTLRQQHVEDAIIPRLHRNQSVLNHYFIPLFDNSGKLFLAYDDPSVENREIELKENDTYVKCGVMTQNEVRVKLGYEPHPDGDTLANPIGTAAQDTGDVGDADTGTDTETPQTTPQGTNSGEQDIQTLPQCTLNGTQIVSATAIVQSVASGQLPRDSGIGQLEVLLNLTAAQAEQVMGSVGNGFTAPIQETPINEPEKVETEEDTKEEPPETEGKTAETHKALECGCGKTHKPKGRELATILKKCFKMQKEDILASLNRQKTIHKALPDRFVSLEKLGWNKTLYEHCQPQVMLQMNEGYHKNQSVIIAKTGIDPAVFSVGNPHLKEKAHKLTLQFCEETNKCTSKKLDNALADLRSEMAEGLEQGDRMSDLAKRVSDIFDNASDERADLIAQTESSRCWSESLRQSAKDSGVVTGFRLMLSSEACELCKEVADTEFGLDDVMYTDDTAPDSYQDKFGPPIHPGCECDLEQIFADEKETDSE